jgi:hydrogenase expression/formation protein HypE
MKNEIITLNHGAGGMAMRRLITDHFVDRFDNPALSMLADAAMLEVNGSRLAFSTDSYVIKPIEFPGGDIGKLAVCGTVNDLAVMGARPLYLSIGFILEEGLSIDLLKRIADSAAEIAQIAGVNIVTGDTKVVARGECDGMFINTSGIGLCPLGKGLSKSPIAAGDTIIVSGTLGDHGIAVLSAREGLTFQTDIESDCAPLNDLVFSVLSKSAGVKWMRDPTRSGVAAALTELIEQESLGIILDETAIPVREDVNAVCELLGFDPLYLANEGKVLMVVEAKESERIIEILRAHPLGRNAAVIGNITADSPGHLHIKTTVGSVRRLQLPSGELLPRIC